MHLILIYIKIKLLTREFNIFYKSYKKQNVCIKQYIIQQ